LASPATVVRPFVIDCLKQKQANIWSVCFEKVELLLHPLVANPNLSLHIPRQYPHRLIASPFARVSEIFRVEDTKEFESSTDL
jgi:hypothetical protein